MSEEEFSKWIVPICIGGLMLLILFIMGNLAKESKAGKVGTIVIFLALGAGLAMFLAHPILAYFMEK